MEQKENISYDSIDYDLQAKVEDQQGTDLKDAKKTESSRDSIEEIEGFIDAFFPFVSMVDDTRSAYAQKLSFKDLLHLVSVIFFLWGASLCELMISLNQEILYIIIMILTAVSYVVFPVCAFKLYKYYIADIIKEDFPISSIAPPLRLFFKYAYLLYIFYALLLYMSFQTSAITYVIIAGALLASCLIGDIILQSSIIKQTRKQPHKVNPVLLSKWCNSIKGISIIYLIGIAFYIWRLFRI